MLDKLMELGFSMNEAKVYLALVKLGSGTTSDITKESGVHRVNTYEVIAKLQNKGLVSSLKKGKKSLYSVGDPKNVLRFVQQKEEIAKEIVPELCGLYNIKKQEEEVFYFNGPEGVITAYYMMLETGAKTIYGIGGSGLNRKFLKHRHKRFDADRTAAGVKTKGLYYESLREQKLKNLEKGWEVRFLPDEFKSPAMLDVCGDVVVILLATDTIRAIVIKNKDIASAYINYFEFMWQFAKE
jgi:HTH-type transcriptional regulator, sugar sensing transcriptional regulator